MAGWRDYMQLVDDDMIWNWSSVYTGAYLYMGVHF